jgi:hypothetical protein
MNQTIKFTRKICLRSGNPGISRRQRKEHYSVIVTAEVQEVHEKNSLYPVANYPFDLGKFFRVVIK